MAQNEKGAPKQTKSGDWLENENLAKTRSEETKVTADDWPGGGMLGETQSVGQEGRREAKQTRRGNDTADGPYSWRT